MLFRPEVVHCTSGKVPPFRPFQKGNRHVPDQPFGIHIQDVPVLDLQMNWFTAIETGSVDLDCLAWEKPADRQRFEGSLAEPFLPATDGDSILIG